MVTRPGPPNRCHVYLWCYIVLFFLLFVLLFSLKPRPFVQSFFNIHAPRQPYYVVLPNNCLRPFLFSFLSFCFVFFGDVVFPSIFVLVVWRVRRTSFPSGWCFSTLWPWARFFTSVYYVRKFSPINQNQHDKKKEDGTIIDSRIIPVTLYYCGYVGV